MAAVFTGKDERLGGWHGRFAFVQYLITDIALLRWARCHNDGLRRQLLSVASRTAKVLEAFSVHRRAGRYYARADGPGLPAHQGPQDGDGRTTGRRGGRRRASGRVSSS